MIWSMRERESESESESVTEMRIGLFIERNIDAVMSRW